MSTLKWFLHIFLKCGKWEFSCRWQFCLNLPLRLLLSTIWTNLYILRSTQKMLNGPLFGVLLHSCLKLDFFWEDQKEPDHKRAFDWTCTLWWKHVNKSWCLKTFWRSNHRWRFNFELVWLLPKLTFEFVVNDIKIRIVVIIWSAILWKHSLAILVRHFQLI